MTYVADSKTAERRANILYAINVAILLEKFPCFLSGKITQGDRRYIRKVLNALHYPSNIRTAVEIGNEGLWLYIGSSRTRPVRHK